MKWKIYFQYLCPSTQNLAQSGLWHITRESSILSASQTKTQCDSTCPLFFHVPSKQRSWSQLGPFELTSKHAELLQSKLQTKTPQHLILFIEEYVPSIFCWYWLFFTPFKSIVYSLWCCRCSEPGRSFLSLCRFLISSRWVYRQTQQATQQKSDLVEEAKSS